MKFYLVSEDQVYLEDKDEREEYVMNEAGRIFVGNSFWPGSRPWVFGQFSQYCLQAAIKVLEEKDPEARSCGNPTKVTRILSGMVSEWLPSLDTVNRIFHSYPLDCLMALGI